MWRIKGADDLESGLESYVHRVALWEDAHL